MNVPGLKEFLGNYMMLFFTAMTILYFMHCIVTKMKNRKKMKQSQQIIRIGLKILKSVY